MDKPLAYFFIIICSIVICSFSGDYNQEVVVEPLLKTDTTSVGQSINYPCGTNEEVSMVKVVIAPGKETRWHKHSFPVFAFVEKGTLTVDIENHGTQTFVQGSTFAEVIDTYHNGKNTGKEDVVLIAIYMGQKGKALSEKRTEQNKVK